MAPRAGWLLVIAALALAGCGGKPAPDPAAGPEVSCFNVILNVRDAVADGSRPILGGAVAVPPAYIGQVVRTKDREWPFWEKAGLLVHTGRGPVDITVPARARSYAAVAWGNGASPRHGLRITRCPGKDWNVYAGGFFLKHRRACVPVTFRVGDRRTTVTFGLRTHCKP